MLYLSFIRGKTFLLIAGQSLVVGKKIGHRKGYPWHEIVMYVAEKGAVVGDRWS